MPKFAKINLPYKNTPSLTKSLQSLAYRLNPVRVTGVTFSISEMGHQSVAIMHHPMVELSCHPRVALRGHPHRFIIQEAIAGT